jgi:hypothetical protein
MRGRPPKVIPSERINLHLPADIKARLDVHLFSDVEGRIPKGAYSVFFEDCTRKFFAEFDKRPA